MTLPLALAGHQHVGHLADLGVADPVAELLVAVVELGADPGGPQPLVHGAPVVGVLLADGQHPGLHGGEPGGKGPRVVLDEHADEALERAQARAVDHHRPPGLPVMIRLGPQQAETPPVQGPFAPSEPGLYVRRFLGTRPSPRDVRGLTPEALDQLRSLGYLQ